MTRKQRVRRAALLSCYCLRNIAFYRAGWNGKQPRSQEPFWVGANGNFLDVAILEWCKIFADKKGAHHWAKIVSDTNAFTQELVAKLEITEAQLGAYIETVKFYRDKFVAHLDSEFVMQIPQLALAHRSASFFYDHLRAIEDEGDFFPDAPATAEGFYRRMAREARVAYEALEAPHGS